MTLPTLPEIDYLVASTVPAVDFLTTSAISNVVFMVPFAILPGGFMSSESSADYYILVLALALARNSPSLSSCTSDIESNSPICLMYYFFVDYVLPIAN